MGSALIGVAVICIWFWVNSLERQIKDLERRVSDLDDPFRPRGA